MVGRGERRGLWGAGVCGVMGGGAAFRALDARVGDELEW